MSDMQNMISEQVCASSV